MKHSFSSYLTLLGLWGALCLPLSAQVNWPENIVHYTELRNPTPPDAARWAQAPTQSIGWGDIDTRYKKEVPYALSTAPLHLTAWQGENVPVQWGISTRTGGKTMSYRIGSFVRQDKPEEQLHGLHSESGFVRYVMTDDFNPGGGGNCGHRQKQDFDSSLVADPIDHLITSLPLSPQQTQMVWTTLQVPTTATPGTYEGHIEVLLDGAVAQTLPIVLQVVNHRLPTGKERTFHLDLWQNPYAVARLYKVEPWSPEHLRLLRQEFARYAAAGGASVTVSLINKPWNGQTEDAFDEMVRWVKHSDGTWTYDYTVFDLWVNLMFDLGIDKQINCYSMIPWGMSFRYYDEKSASYQYLKTNTASADYRAHWTRFIRDFEQHLRSKGWFEKTILAMDERPMQDMKNALSVVREASPTFKVSLAGALHNEIEADLYDLCVALRYKFTPEQMAARRAKGQITTFYTSCEESYPNTFTFNGPADSEWFGWYAAKAGLDGYLRWALNSWVSEPLQDSRFRTWPAGDTYLIYPGGRSSLRLERMLRGMQAYEKIKILRQTFTAAQDQNSLDELNRILSAFDESRLTHIPASAGVIRTAHKALDMLITGKHLEDVTERYLKNANPPFKTTTDYLKPQTITYTNAAGVQVQGQRYVMLQDWQLSGALGKVGQDMTAWHVDMQKKTNGITGTFTLTSGWGDFAPSFENMKVYQQVTLPAGEYTFATSLGQDRTALPYVYIVAGRDSLPHVADLQGTQTIAASRLSEDMQISFTLPQTSTITLGLVGSYPTPLGTQGYSAALGGFRLTTWSGGTNTNALKTAIQQAAALTPQDYPLGVGPGDYQQDLWDHLQSILNKAQHLLTQPEVTQQAVTQMTAELKTAQEVFLKNWVKPFVLSTDSVNVWYQLVDNRETKSYMYHTAMGEVPHQLKWRTEDTPTDEHGLFKFVAADEAETSFYIYNKAYPEAPMAVSLQDASCISLNPNPSAQTWAIDRTQQKRHYVVHLSNDRNKEINSFRGNENKQKIGFWGPAPEDFGNQWEFRFAKSILTNVMEAQRGEAGYVLQGNQVKSLDPQRPLAIYALPSMKRLKVTQRLPRGAYYIIRDIKAKHGTTIYIP